MLHLAIYWSVCCVVACIALLRDPNPPSLHPLMWVGMVLVSPAIFAAIAVVLVVHFVKWFLFSGWKRLID